MYSIMKRLRFGGVRRNSRDITQDNGVVGEVRLVIVDETREMTVCRVGSAGLHVPLLPILYRATVVTMHGSGMLVRGFERVHRDDLDTEDRRQEWSSMLNVPLDAGRSAAD